jgi:hypothetical protein
LPQLICTVGRHVPAPSQVRALDCTEAEQTADVQAVPSA